MSDIEKKPLPTELTDEQSEEVTGGDFIFTIESPTEDTPQHQLAPLPRI